jgi:hypothetical protein
LNVSLAKLIILLRKYETPLNLYDFVDNGLSTSMAYPEEVGSRLHCSAQSGPLEY